MIKHINDLKEFKEAIAEGKVLVDFFATWCGPCKMIAPVLEEIDEEKLVSDLTIIKVDVDEAQEIAYLYHISSIPTLIYFKDGKTVNTTLGYKNKNQLLEFLAK